MLIAQFWMAATLALVLQTPGAALGKSSELLLLDGRPVVLNRRLGLALWRGLLFALYSEKFYGLHQMLRAKKLRAP